MDMLSFCCACQGCSGQTCTTIHVPISSISSAMSMKRKSCCHKFPDIISCIGLFVSHDFPGSAPKDSLMLITNYLAAVPEMVRFWQK